MILYHIRIKCEDQNGWHYYREVQEVIDPTIVCTTHPNETAKDFTIETTEDTGEA